MKIKICFLLLFFQSFDFCFGSDNATYQESKKSRVRRIVGGYPAKMPPYDDPLVFINFAGRFAKVRGVLDFPHYVFRGLRFAEPPIKKERFQYRLGSLGFLSTQSAELPGNAGFWDMVMAVRWVRNYIGYFGGNPYNIVVMGHGSGASSAMLMALNKVAKGYANGVIALSGTAVSNWAMDDDPNGVARELAETQGCPTTSALAMIKCLQSIPAQNIINADSQIQMQRVNSRGFMGAMSRSLGASPVVEGVHDGRSLPSGVEHEPFKQMSEGNIPNIPLFTGVTKEETKRAVNSVFKDEVLQSLQTKSEFLNKVLIQELQSFTAIGKESIIGSQNGLWKTLDSFKFGKYIDVAKNNVVEAFGKITEATADALFNLPAFLSVNLWSKSKAPTFLYSFDHIPKVSKAHYFLAGLPFVGNNSAQERSASHGEDLAFLFDAYTLEGEPLDLNGDFTEEDMQVRNVFVEAIASFAKHKKISFENKDLPSFSSSNNNFFQISSAPKIESNFRFCQMGLWAGLADRLQDAQCKVFNILDSELKNYQKQLFDVAGVPQKNLPKVPNVGIGGLTSHIGQNLGGIFGKK
ncbi:neuroligin-2-like isoform X2 [Agrilus planipennis]|uniref:Neuroligin-2 isoform X2 n=1 Tax=Agrilus planipennis TaxID=224129 RepID=A0A7F5RI59_AGRPL|nr:neuroligin-2 isoform X2 [Agrilus planipennis]XP_025835673.1 neuroligin-2-like isoform X2 [Agrilus planipennis]